MNKEVIVGIATLFVMVALVAVLTGIYGIIFLGVTFLVAAISINLFSRKSATAKTGAVILNTDLIYKILMPRKYKAAIKELKEKESHE
jgi:asparagine N-glycosylation enzyme membrane subunit Stt3